MLRAGVSATKLRVREPAAVGAASSDRREARVARTSGITMATPATDRPTIHGTGIIIAGRDRRLDRTLGAVAGGQGARRAALFERLGEAEAAIHQMPVERVHLHEVGALDSIIDIVGAVFAMEWLGVDDVVASPLNVGGGTVQMRARRVSGAGAGDAAAAGGRADLQPGRSQPSW